MPKYPQVKVRLVGEDGNAFSILGRCERAARGKLSEAQMKEFRDDATSRDYDHLLQTVMAYFTCDEPEED